MPLTPESVADHITSILPDLDKGNFESCAADLQQYPVMQVWLKKLKIEMSGGLQVRENLMQTTSGAARHVTPDSTDQVDIPNLMSYVTVPWRRIQTQWAYDYQVDILMNKDPHAIINLVKARLHAAMIDLAAELEAKAWSLCAPDNQTDPYGVPNWIVYTATANPGGFTGGLASGWTHKAGLTDLTNFKNYSATYTTVSKTDLLVSMRQGHEQTFWLSPVTTEQANTDMSRMLRYYTDSTTNRAFETLGEAQNENLGRDIAPYVSGSDPDLRRDDMIGGAALTFRRHPICFVPYFNDTSRFPTSIATNPIYGIDHSKFKTRCLKGDYLRQTGPERVPNQHNRWRTFSDTTYAHTCNNLRRQQVFSK